MSVSRGQWMDAPFGAPLPRLFGEGRNESNKARARARREDDKCYVRARASGFVSPGPIGIGGNLAAPPLPLHRTYGSVSGGSLD